MVDRPGSLPGRRGTVLAEDYDLIALGAGTAGMTVTRLLAKRGWRVALAEHDEPGGDCLHTGCIPTKALLEAAGAAHGARKAGRFGVETGPVSIDFARVRAHVQHAMAQAGRPDTEAALAADGVSLLRGRARFSDGHTLDVAGRPYTAGNFVIATGCEAVMPPVPGLDRVPAETNAELLAWDSLPESLAILGGGPIGVEFAQGMARLGVRVTLVEAASRLLANEEARASELVTSALRNEGVTVHTGATATRASSGQGGISLELSGSQATHVSSERLLVATGRKPRIGDLGLDVAGVSVRNGAIRIDGQLRTSQAHIFAAGDVAGGPQFTHVAEDQGRFLANLLTARTPLGRRARWNGRVVPRVTFTDPEVASVGLTEEEARAHRLGVRAWEFGMDEIDRAITLGQTGGFIKLVTARGWMNRVPWLAVAAGDELAGATIAGPNAGELLPALVMAMRARLPAGLVAWNMQAYPTLAVGIRQALAPMFEQSKPARRR